MRACYLHEAGHAIVAIHYGQIVNEVKCDGAEGHVDREDPPILLQRKAALESAFKNRQTSPEQLLKLALSVWEGDLVTLLAGLAGESLELGRPLTSICRGADDLASTFMIIAPLLGPFPIGDKHARLTSTFRSMSEKANELTKQKQKEIRSIADALQVKHLMSKSEIDFVLAGN